MAMEGTDFRQFTHREYGSMLMAMAGDDYTITALDTMTIAASGTPKTYQLYGINGPVIGCFGNQDGVLKLLGLGLKMHENEHHNRMSTTAIADKLSIIHKNRSNDTYNFVVGLDDEGKGCVYSFCLDGSLKRNTLYACAPLSQLFENQKSALDHGDGAMKHVPSNRAIDFVKSFFSQPDVKKIFKRDTIVIHHVSPHGGNILSLEHLH